MAFITHVGILTKSICSWRYLGSQGQQLSPWVYYIYFHKVVNLMILSTGAKFASDRRFEYNYSLLGFLIDILLNVEVLLFILGSSFAYFGYDDH